ncbi:hypothetical protein GGTG_13706 [Gaeumannomyces tritici R3-111a-1]|uniref:Uncharacterized protein n=1 Tax=Gaeumannomyces tritici (strain R3-111a-1) TaxID=644352 RepID=J3PJL9_GAET3|nr:hypothetical protein GGTG_13706 [Gaeumannomyces tritici R3-111a-1]EJT68719.1 hypothetical protein GGTG_13706 [Gaeumannomyces tritici R3-111a-1]
MSYCIAQRWGRRRAVYTLLEALVLGCRGQFLSRVLPRRKLVARRYEGKRVVPDSGDEEKWDGPMPTEAEAEGLRTITNPMWRHIGGAPSLITNLRTTFDVCHAELLHVELLSVAIPLSENYLGSAQDKKDHMHWVKD